MTVRSVLGASIALVLASCAAPSSQPRPESLASESIGPEGSAPESVANDGREIAEAQCAACHAVGSYGESPNIAAPHFRTILSRYRADVLEEELIAGLQVAHPMPEFQFNPQGADALIAYLHSIQETPEPERRARRRGTSGPADVPPSGHEG